MTNLQWKYKMANGAIAAAALRQRSSIVKNRRTVVIIKMTFQMAV